LIYYKPFKHTLRRINTVEIILRLSVSLRVLFNHSVFETSNNETLPYLGPKHSFFVWEMLLKNDHFFGAAPSPIIKVLQGLQEGGCAPFGLGGFGGFEVVR
jgi:hypothetical protein